MASEAKIVPACLNLMRRLPPNDMESNLAALVTLVPDQADELLQRVDQPLQSALDAASGRDFLLCEYNRDADSYRSPWSNKYEPSLEEGYEGYAPRDMLRKMEVDANELFDEYRKLYYDGGTSSVYLWDLEEGSSGGGGGVAAAFAGAFLLKKDVGDCYWHSIHIVQVVPEPAPSKRAAYKLSTTVMLRIALGDPAAGEASLSGNLTRSAEQTASFAAADDHLVTIGKMIEAMETSVRRDIDGLYVQKTRQASLFCRVLSAVRSKSAAGPMQGSTFTNQLNAAIGMHGAKKTMSPKRPPPFAPTPPPRWLAAAATDAPAAPGETLEET
ncbi:unnamed protein product [Phaeothamnion confervicola]